MSFLHTPGCRIVWTDVAQGSRHNTIRIGEPLFLSFGVTLDTGIWFLPGNFSIDFTILGDGDVINRPNWSGWIATQLPGRPSPGIWLQWFWAQAGDATEGREGIFQFRPRIDFGIEQGIYTFVPDEWAVSEEENFFSVEQ